MSFVLNNSANTFTSPFEEFYKQQSEQDNSTKKRKLDHEEITNSWNPTLQKQIKNDIEAICEKTMSILLNKANRKHVHQTQIKVIDREIREFVKGGISSCNGCLESSKEVGICPSCSHTSCEECAQKCAVCSAVYCSFCITTNYSGKEDFLECLDCKFKS